MYMCRNLTESETDHYMGKNISRYSGDIGAMLSNMPIKRVFSASSLSDKCKYILNLPLQNCN